MVDENTTQTVNAEGTPDAEKTNVAFIENLDHAGRIANQEEHDVGALKAMKMYPWALAWCSYAVWMIVLASFENQAGNCPSSAS